MKVIHFAMDYDDYLRMTFFPDEYRIEMEKKYGKEMIDKEFGV